GASHQDQGHDQSPVRSRSAASVRVAQRASFFSFGAAARQLRPRLDARKLYGCSQKVSNAHAGKMPMTSPEGTRADHRNDHSATRVAIGQIVARSGSGSLSKGPGPDGRRKMRAKSSRLNAWANC